MAYSDGEVEAIPRIMRSTHQQKTMLLLLRLYDSSFMRSMLQKERAQRPYYDSGNNYFFLNYL